ncbi:hypothetical protein AAFF_G00163090 [Aldrovandia affinis]|uniref:IF rod domain-containing protein n=1 Tax=Aldrovandia affinis TaxID=143900 RepID=A0AAD7T193_9TELE|nr:hypothetical protein AAFF_G00163090 [Aldrovandia affinis]
MSRSPERISSYRRHFEPVFASSYHVRVSSPSPTRRDARHRSASYGRSAAVAAAPCVGRRTASITSRSRGMVSMSMGAICYAGPGGALDLDAAAAENQEFITTRSGERREMIVLNDRLAAYIEKARPFTLHRGPLPAVSECAFWQRRRSSASLALTWASSILEHVRTLEHQNKLLETEIQAMQDRYVKPSGLRMLYEDQLREMKRVVDQLRRERDMAAGAKDAVAVQLDVLRVKFEDAMALRRMAELEIEAFRPDVDAATSARIALEKQLENMEGEIAFLLRVHKEEIEALMKQIYAASTKAEAAFGVPDLATALKQVQAHYDCIAAKNLQEMDAWYKAKFEDLNNASTKHVEMVRRMREEIASIKKEIQSKQYELESLRNRNEVLEAQIREAQQKYKKGEENLQAKIDNLQLQLKSIKERIALHLREYQELLNIKMSLEIEITTYRKLIEGEDLRLAGMVKSMSLIISSSSMNALSAGMGIAVGVSTGKGKAVKVAEAKVEAKAEAKAVAPDEGKAASLVEAEAVSLVEAEAVSLVEAEAVSLGEGEEMAAGLGAGTEGAAAEEGPAEAGEDDDQGEEMTERTTVVIRTVKAEDDTMHSDTQERTIIISGAPEDTDEEE